ncbi:MAG: B12-binding domain-containing radical SAM protein, partial [Magnetococcales bacterium]|nr:B12-binding domain-containing radical SAM protein [Magnetococcales bacterium]
MAQIVLFRPREHYSSRLPSNHVPLGLICVATALQEAGFSVVILDTSDTSMDPLTRLDAVVGPETLLAGVGVMTGYQIDGAIRFSRAVKALRQDLPVVWGGLHPSMLPEQTIRHPAADVVLIGEGEARIVAVAKHLQQGLPLNGIEGLYLRQEDEIIATPPVSSFLDLNTLPLPDFNFVDADYYARQRRSFMAHGSRCLDLNPDRGCPHKCSFCYNLEFNRRRWRAMDPERVVDQVAQLMARHQLDAINFTSDEFFINKKRVRKICEELLKRQIQVCWHSDIRVDTFLQYEDDLLTLLMQAGCKELTFGIESGSDRMLKLIDKGITVAQVRKAHARLMAFGFRVNYHFMLGFPEETLNDMQQTIQLILELTQEKQVVIYGPSIYIPYPGTPLFARSVAMGFQPPQDLEGWITYDWTDEPKLPWFQGWFARYID